VRREFKPVLTSSHDTGLVWMPIDHERPCGRRGIARAFARQWQRRGWAAAGALALLCSGVAWASLPRVVAVPIDQQRQWQALGVAPLSNGGVSGMPMAPTDADAPVGFVPRRAVVAAPVVAAPAPIATGPLRIRGRVGDGLYWSLRAAGASPQVAAQYLAALATEIDVGDVGSDASFDMVLGPNRELLYAGLSRAADHSLQLVRWT